MDDLRERQYIKFISYVPDFWHIERILKKKVKDLKKVELEILRQYLDDQMLVDTLLTAENREEILEKYSIDEIARLKMTNFQMNIVYEKMNSLKDLDYEELRKVFEDMQNVPIMKRTIGEEYVIYKLDILLNGLVRKLKA